MFVKLGEKSSVCYTNADCPTNKDQPSAVEEKNSAWCYEFAVGNNHCLQLRRKENSPDCPGGGKNCSTTIEEARRQLVRAGGPFQNSSCAEVTSAVCNNCGVFVPPNAIRTALCPAGSCGGGATPPPTPTPVPSRQALCQTTTANKTVLNPGESITVTSTAKSPVKKFMFAFFNNDNNNPDGSGPKLISFGGSDYTPQTELSIAQAQASKTFSFSELSRPDGNWGGQVPQRIQVNGYFFDNQNMQSLPDSACVANFTLAALPTPTPTPVPANRMPGDADDNRCVNIADYNIWKQERQSQVAKCADWVGGGSSGNAPDGAADASDFGIWYREFQIDSKRDGCIIPTPNTCLNQR